jgi:DNA-binding response OmpR family regulator
MLADLGAPARVLIVDDEPLVREVVAAYLVRDGFIVDEASDGRMALDRFRSARPDLVVLDVMLPNLDGYSVLTELRSTADVPVILLTARTDESDRVLGLVLRRSRHPVARERLEFEGLAIDGTTRDVLVDGAAVDLTPKEFDLLIFLAESPRQVFSRGQLLEHVWGSSPDYQDPSTVTVHVRRVRLKIEKDPNQPRWITTVWGVGYRFES